MDIITKYPVYIETSPPTMSKMAKAETVNVQLLTSSFGTGV